MDQKNKTVITLTAGILIGFGLAYFFLKEKDELKDPEKIKEDLNQVKKKISDKISETSGHVEDFLNELMDKGEVKADDLIEVLQAKLNQLKADKTN